MAAFVLTLVPAAAFGATADVAPVESSVQTVEKKVKVDIGDVVNFKLNLKQADGKTSADQADVYVWLEKTTEEGTVVARNVTYYPDKDGVGTVGNEYLVGIDNGIALRADNSDDEREMSLAINEAGTYTIKAGVLKNSQLTTADELSDLIKLENVPNYSTIEVAVPEVADLTFTCADANSITVSDADDTVYTMDLIGDDFIANTSDTCEVVGTIVDEDRHPIANKEVKLSSADKGSLVHWRCS